MSYLDHTRQLQVDNWILAAQRERNARFATMEQPDAINIPAPIPLPEQTPEEKRYFELDAIYTGRMNYKMTDAEKKEYWVLQKKLFGNKSEYLEKWAEYARKMAAADRAAEAKTEGRVHQLDRHLSNNFHD